MMTRCWAATRGANRGAKVEEHTFRDGTKHYSFRDRLGRPHDLTEKEKDSVLRTYCMEDVTEQMRKEGWIA